MTRDWPFTKQAPHKASILDRLRRRPPKKNALIVLNNLLAETSDVRSITAEDVRRTGATFGVDWEKEFRVERYEFLRSYVRYCVSDGQVTSTEDENMDYLCNLFHLPKTIVIDIYKSEAAGLVQKHFDVAIADQILSPEEDQRIKTLAEALRVDMRMDSETERLVDKYRLHWRIVNADVSEIPVDIHLQRGEKCHFKTWVDWFETRRRTTRVRYGGPTARIKIAKGLYWRMGDVGVRSVSEDVWTQVDSGQLYLTNKRLLFMGARGNKTIRLNRILDWTVYSNGVEIAKDSGKNPFLEFSDRTDTFAVVLGRLITDLTK